MELKQIYDTESQQPAYVLDVRTTNNNLVRVVISYPLGAKFDESKLIEYLRSQAEIISKLNCTDVQIDVNYESVDAIIK